MGLMNLIDGVGHLTAAPILVAMDLAAPVFDGRTVPLDHCRDLFALVRMDQKHNFIVSHRCSPWVISLLDAPQDHQ